MSLRSRNGKWHYRFQLDGKVWTDSTGYKAIERNRSAALLKEEQDKQKVREGKDPARERLVVLSFIDAAAHFLEWAEQEHREHPRTARRLWTSFASLTVFFRDHRAVSRIDEGAIEDFKTWRRGNGIREVTIRHDLHALSKFFRFAIKKRWARENPIRKVDIPSDKDAIRTHVVAPAEEKLYFLHASGSLYDLGRLMLNQGCRPEELLSLRCSDVDIYNRTLRIRRGKTEAARRTLNLTSESLHILAQRLSPGQEWLFPSPKRPGAHIVRLNSQHEAVLEKAGLNFVLYDFRHTFATRLAEAGVDLATLAAILGHSGLRVVERYIHVSAEHQRQAMSRYEQIMVETQENAKKSVQFPSSFRPVLQ